MLSRVVVHVVSIPKPLGSLQMVAMLIADTFIRREATIPMVTRSTSASDDVRCLVMHNPAGALQNDCAILLLAQVPLAERSPAQRAGG